MQGIVEDVPEVGIHTGLSLDDRNSHCHKKSKKSPQEEAEKMEGKSRTCGWGQKAEEIPRIQAGLAKANESRSE